MDKADYVKLLGKRVSIGNTVAEARRRYKAGTKLELTQNALDSIKKQGCKIYHPSMYESTQSKQRKQIAALKKENDKLTSLYLKAKGDDHTKELESEVKAVKESDDKKFKIIQELKDQISVLSGTEHADILQLKYENKAWQEQLEVEKHAGGELYDKMENTSKFLTEYLGRLVVPASLHREVLKIVKDNEELAGLKKEYSELFDRCSKLKLEVHSLQLYKFHTSEAIINILKAGDFRG